MQYTEPRIDYVDHMGDDLRVVNSARVSFAKEKSELDKKDEKLIKYLATAKPKHFSPFTHPQICVRITAPIFIARQWFKSTVGIARNEESRRYIDTPPSYWKADEWCGRPQGGLKQGADGPLDFETQKKVMGLYENSIKLADQTYMEMLELGVAPQQARAVLPQSMITSWYETLSLMAMARIYGLRFEPHVNEEAGDKPGAQRETKMLAAQLNEIGMKYFPVSWKALTT